MKNSEYEKIEFKGSKEGIIIDLNDEKDFDTIANAIVSKIESSKSFFNGARIYKIDSDFLSEENKNKLKELISSKFNIEFFKEEDKKKISPKKNSNIDKLEKKEEKIEGKHIKKDEDCKQEEVVEIKNSKEEIVASEDKSGECTDKTKYISKMRSGDFIESNGNIVVMTDMNPGSKVISGKDILIMGDMCVGSKAVARGNVVVFGNLFGFVHAGSEGDKNSYIAAKNLKPTILQIADIIAEAPEEYEQEEEITENIESEIAFISENMIMIETQIGK